MATRTTHSVDRTVDKMLRKMAKSSQAAAGSSASSSTAAQALAQMAEIQKRIARGDPEAAQFLIEKASLSQNVADNSSVDVLRESMREARRKKASLAKVAQPSKQHLLIGAGVAIACLLAVIVAVGGFRSAGHSVQGTIYVDEQSAADLEMVFHSVSKSDVRIKLRTSSDGSFVVESLPPGDYKIILLPTDGVHAIPKHYSSPISTPLRLKLHEDTSNLTMNVASERNMRQG
jgi:hypothetical protein